MRPESLPLTRNVVKRDDGVVREVDVIDDPRAAEAALDPVRSRLLAELRVEPGSAATLAARVGLGRQKVNYHLHTLESHGLVELAEIRMRGGIAERVLRATARDVRRLPRSDRRQRRRIPSGSPIASPPTT